MTSEIIRTKAVRRCAPILIGAAILFLYSSVIVGLVRHWWADDNYSHGLLIPFVIAFIIWQGRESLRRRFYRSEAILGAGIVLFGLLMLTVGTLGAELFTQRLSLVVVFAGTVVFFFGRQILGGLFVPFLLLLLAIPIPQIVLNKVAFPLQLLATRIAAGGISLFGIESFRRGNVIELLPFGESKYVGLEVVEACSGIRSLVTLATLSVVLVYFTRTSTGGLFRSFRTLHQDRDVLRGGTLVALAVPIALVTNAARVLLTGVATYWYGPGVTDSWLHDAFGWATFLAGLGFLFVANVVLVKFLTNSGRESVTDEAAKLLDFSWSGLPAYKVVLLLILLLAAAGAIDWFQMRTENPVQRKRLEEMPTQLGDAIRPLNDKRFSPATEQVLKATDYVMRDYYSEERRFNLYVGYYASQRTGATYHSPQNCLPGSGWEMSDGSTVEMVSPAGRRVIANRYVVTNGARRSIMIYWYQGRGRTSASEYWDKLYTIADSITKGRSDGAMVRVMTPVLSGESDADAFNAVKNFSGTIADSLSEFVPD